MYDHNCSLSSDSPKICLVGPIVQYIWRVSVNWCRKSLLRIPLGNELVKYWPQHQYLHVLFLEAPSRRGWMPEKYNSHCAGWRNTFPVTFSKTELINVNKILQYSWALVQVVFFFVSFLFSFLRFLFVVVVVFPQMWKTEIFFFTWFSKEMPNPGKMQCVAYVCVKCFLNEVY